MKQFFQDIWANLHNYYQELVLLMPRLVLGLLIFVSLWWLASRIQTGLKRRLSEKMDDPLLAKFLARVVKILIVFTALMVFMHIVGLTHLATGLITGASVSAIVIGFAFKDIVENFLAGIMLAFNRPFRVGDIVELDGNKGVVVSLDLRTTHIKTFDGKDIYIPNASIVKNPLVNYTIDGFIRQDFSIGLDYNSDVNKAIQVIVKELGAVNGIMQENKAPSVMISDVADNKFNLNIYYWLDTFNKEYNGLAVRTEAIAAVLHALSKEGFYFPADVVELKNYQNACLFTKQ